LLRIWNNSVVSRVVLVGGCHEPVIMSIQTKYQTMHRGKRAKRRPVPTVAGSESAIPERVAISWRRTAVPSSKGFGQQALQENTLGMSVQSL
jgi:hypothetical protein